MNVWKKCIVVLGIILIIIMVLCVVPICVGVVTTAQLLNVNTESQWIGFWGNYLGAFIGGTISGCITLFVMIKTFEDGKKERRLLFCDNIIESCTLISNSAAQVTLVTQKFLQNAQEKHHSDAILRKNAIVDEIWKTTTKLEAKRDTYAFAYEMYGDLIAIAKCISSFSINDLDYTDESASKELVKSITESDEYKKAYNDCFAAAKGIESNTKELAEHMKSFYNENTKKLL